MSAISIASERAAWRLVRGALAIAAALLLGACYPDLDWREVSSTEGGYAVLLPAKPERATREVAIGGRRLVLNMASVHKEGMAFGVAYATLPAATTEQDKLLADARDALVRNIGGRLTTDRTLEIAGNPGREFVAEGTAEGEPMRLAARVLATNDRFYQIVFVGRSGRGAESEVSMFLESFRLLPR
jgi:hypothetical protein